MRAPRAWLSWALVAVFITVVSAAIPAGILERGGGEAVFVARHDDLRAKAAAKKASSATELKPSKNGAVLRKIKEERARPTARQNWLKGGGGPNADAGVVGGSSPARHHIALGVAMPPAIAGIVAAAVRLGTSAWEHVASHPVLETVLGRFAVAAAVVGVKFASDEGLRRAAFFWSTAVPVYIHYQIVDKMTIKWPEAKRQAAFEELHERYAPTLLYVFHTLGGFYIKIGQNGANREDFVPKQFTERLRTLEDGVPPEADASFARRVVQKSLRMPISKAFRHFEDKPLGSASIGQCHRAELHDGTQVVVKVMRPAAKRIFEGDVSTLESFCKLAQPHIVPSFEEIRKQFGTEFNYTEEAINMEMVGDAVNPDWEGRVRVPRPIMELCTENVLVMEYVPGIKLVEAVRRQAHGEARRRGITIEELKEEHSAWMRRPPSCITAASSMKRAVAIKIMRAGLSLARAPRRLARALGVCGRPIAPPHEHPQMMPVDPSAMLKRLLEVHADQLFKYGALNGDPHPGNVLLMPDGRLGLIDFGQVALLSLENRLIYAQLIVALATKNRRKIIETYHRMGYRTKKGDPDVCVAWATILNDRDDEGVLEGFNFQGYMEELQRRDAIKTVPEAFITVQRATVLLRGCGIALGAQVSIAQAWAPAARALLERHGRFSAVHHGVGGWGCGAGSRARRALVICGPSGVGKGTLIEMLMRDFPGRLGFSVSHTTRKPREGEIDGKHYHFCSKDRIESEIAAGRFLEHARVHGNIYGTSWRAVDDVRRKKKVCVLDIDVKGCVSCRDRDLDGLYIFIAPPSVGALKKRLEGRGTETRKQVAGRVAAAHAEIRQAHTPGLFDVTIVNDKLEVAYDALRELVKREVQDAGGCIPGVVSA